MSDPGFTSDPEFTTALFSRADPGVSEPRLRLKPGMTRTGAVDGGWWPASRDLVAEIPALVEAFPTTAGTVWRVGFGRSRWDAVPHRTRGYAHGRRIGLDGFAAFAPDIVWVATSITGSAPIFLVVVPPGTPADVAADILRRASATDNLDEPKDLLPDRPPAAAAAAPAEAAPREPALMSSHG